MSIHTPDDSRKVTTFRLSEMKERGEKISMLTAYDYTMAGLGDSEIPSGAKFATFTLAYDL